jgi:hypothetical protein
LRPTLDNTSRASPGAIQAAVSGRRKTGRGRRLRRPPTEAPKSEQIKRIDPNFADSELLPEGGVTGLDWQARGNLIDNLRMKLAAEYYLVNGDIKPLRGETLRFVRKAVDKAYAEAANDADGGRLGKTSSSTIAITKPLIAGHTIAYRTLGSAMLLMIGRFHLKPRVISRFVAFSARTRSRAPSLSCVRANSAEMEFA